MLAEPNLPIDDDYDMTSEFSADLLIRQEIEQMRGDIEKIKDRLESFEDQLKKINKKPVSHQNPNTILIGPIAKNLKIPAQSEIENKLEETVQQSLAERNSPINSDDIDEFFDDYAGADVDNLKQQLEEKLRKAEVEMSIQRARVFQQKAELEEMKLQLEEREAAIRKTVDQQKNTDPSKRWDRHFGFLRKK